MATDLERLEILIEANTKQAANAMAKLQKDTARALNASSKSVRSLDNSLKTMAATAVRAAGVLGVAFSARALVGFIKSSVEAGEAVGDLSERLGITAEQLQEFTFAAEQNGSSQEGLATAFRGMTKLLGEVERGSKSARAELAALGLSAADFKNKSPAEVFTILLDRIGKIEDPLRRNAELIKVFGKSGVEMAQLAMKGADGIEALRVKARDLGLVLSNETIKHLQDAGDKLDIIKTASATAGARMTEAFLPAIDALAALVTSHEFQDGLVKTADNIGAIVKLLAENPGLLKILGLAAAGGVVGGLPGAIVGGSAGAADELMKKFGLGVHVGGFGIGAGGAPPASVSVTPGKGVGDLGAGAGLVKSMGDGLGTPFTSPEDDARKKKYEDMTAALEQQLAQLQMNDREQAIANELARLGKDATEQQKGAVAALTGKLFDQKTALDQSRDATRFFAETAAEAFSSLIPQIETGNAALDSMINKLVEAAAQAVLLGQGPLAGLFGMASGTSGVAGGIIGSLFGGFRADGGGVSAGKAYGVGEKGPEIFVPETSGTILPNGSGGGGPVVIQNHYTFTNVDPTMRPWIEARLQQSEQRVKAETIAGVRAAHAKNPNFFRNS